MSPVKTYPLLIKTFLDVKTSPESKCPRFMSKWIGNTIRINSHASDCGKYLQIMQSLFGTARIQTRDFLVRSPTLLSLSSYFLGTRLSEHDCQNKWVFSLRLNRWDYQKVLQEVTVYITQWSVKWDEVVNRPRFMISGNLKVGVYHVWSVSCSAYSATATRWQGRRSGAQWKWRWSKWTDVSNMTWLDSDGLNRLANVNYTFRENSRYIIRHFHYVPWSYF